MNPVSLMLVAYACISPAFACETLINHRPDRFNITEAFGCPPTYAEAVKAIERSVASLGATIDENAKRWDELNQTFARLNQTFAWLNRHIGAAPAPFRVEAAAVPVPVKRKMASRCDGSKAECRISRTECGREFADWRTSKGRRKFRCR